MNDILVHTEAGVTTLTFNRLARKNSITGPMYDALTGALEQGAQDAAVRCVLIQGDVAIFSAGNDIGDFMTVAAAPAEHAPVESPAIRFLRTIAAFPKPIVASVCGPAVGIGTTMLFHCDLVVAGDNAAFSMPFVNLGLVPEAASSLLAPRMFGYHRAAEALLLGQPFLAEAALEVGLVNRVVPPTEANAVAQGLARRLAAKPMSALVETKRLLKLSQQDAVQQRIGAESLSFAEAMRSPAAREAFSAFMQKRKPDFSKA